ncbi:MAG: hypothetical protein ACRDYE_07730 [Acidimicrobiales bacterium]
MVATLRAHGIEVPLPAGFEGRIFTRASDHGAVAYPVAHFATFALPEQVGDFGGGAVNQLGSSDIFTVLFEYGPESVGRRLFARQGMPRAFALSDFRPYVLRRGLPGQSGSQWFFTEAGRPFTLYVVLGSYLRRDVLVPKVNQLLARVAIAPGGPAPTPPTPTSASGGAPWN